MSIQQFCLKWNNHQPNFISVFTTLLNTEALVDVTLAAEGKHVQAHRMVLSACSVYFQALFMETPSRYPIVILKDVKFSVLRILVDFMYYGEVNVSQEQLPQVLETARTLKIKGLTEMPDSTLMRAQGIKNDSMPMSDHIDRPSVSPSHSPLMTKRKKNRRLSLSMGSEDNRQGDSGSSPPSVELAQSDEITLSSVQQQRRRQETYDERTVDATQQTEEQHNNMQADDSLLMETNPPGMPQVIGPTRPRHLLRQSRVRRDSDASIFRQCSEPTPVVLEVEGPSTSGMRPSLQKNNSHPPPAQKKSRRPRIDPPEVDAMASAGESAEGAANPQRASHTPAMRSGPPLSCNYCWNTVDECGRILRRKTQYHCPECQTNLCIVPCFYEYHDGAPDVQVPTAKWLIRPI